MAATYVVTGRGMPVIGESLPHRVTGSVVNIAHFLLLSTTMNVRNMHQHRVRLVHVEHLAARNFTKRLGGCARCEQISDFHRA
jgi:hypothetical protein